MQTASHLTPTSVGEAVQAFEGHLTFKRKSPLTIKQYKPVLRDFAIWAGERTPDSVTTFEIEGGFLASWMQAFVLRNKRQPSPHAVKNVIVTLRSFYAYLSNYGLLVDAQGNTVRNPTLAIEVPDLAQKPNDWLRHEEDEKLLAAEMNAQEKALLWVFRWTGIRNAELRSLVVSDVDFGEGFITVRNGKGGKYRSIPIVPELLVQLRAWMKQLEAQGQYKANGPLFPNRAGVALSAQYVEKVVARVGDRAGIDKLTPHRLRRTFGSHLLNNEVRLEVVSKLLGHASTSITEKAYAELLDQTIRREMLSALA